MFDLVLFLGETSLGKNIANAFARNFSIVRRERLMNGARMERLSPLCAVPYIFLSSIRTISRQATVVFPLKCNKLLHFHCHN